MFQRVGKYLCNAIGEIDFVDYGDRGTSPRRQDTFARYSVIDIIGANKKSEKTADNAINAILTLWVAFFRNTGYNHSG